MFDYHEHENFDQFHSELRFVFEFLRYFDDKKLLHEKVNQRIEKYGRLSGQTQVLLTTIADTKKPPNVPKEYFERGEYNMCNIFEDMWAEGKNEGRIEGKIEGKIEGRAQEIIEIGREVGFPADEILRKLQNKLNISPEKAQEYWDLFATA